jgi:hypothetical protein
MIAAARWPARSEPAKSQLERPRAIGAHVAQRAFDFAALAQAYTPQQTLDCERLLVTLLCRLGPYREHVRLVGGLCPRYLCPAAPPNVPEHVGTQDVDLVLTSSPP